MKLPDTIDRFRIERQIGRGTTGVVYLAWDPAVRRNVAIKLLAPTLELGREDMTLAKFERELRAAGSLSYPNIVVVYNVGRHEDHPFIAMEYIEGSTLEEFLRLGKELSLAKLVDIAYQIGGALDHAHEASVVHRDVKPSNILLGTDGVAKITDFGVAKVPRSTETVTGAVMGTPSYMAPEILVGGKATGASDQFSLAVVLYELLTGERPFRGETSQAVMYCVVNEVPESPRSHGPELPEAIDAVLLRALEKKPGDRYSSCTRLADAFGSALGLERTGDSVARRSQSSAPPIPDRVDETGTEKASEAESTFGATVSPVRERVEGWSRSLLTWASNFGARARVAASAGIAVVPKRARWIAAGVTLVLAMVFVLALGMRPSSTPSPEQGTGPVSTDSPAGEMAELAPVVESPGIPLDERLLPESADEEPLAPRTLRIVSSPPGALVYQDSERLDGVTPLEAVLEPDTDYGLQVERDGYLPSGISVSLETLTPEQLATGVLFFPLRAVPALAEAVAPAPAAIEPEVPAGGPATLSIRLISEVHRGVLMVYWEQEQIVRESFRFKKGGEALDSQGAVGILDWQREVAAGPAELRVYVQAPPGTSAQLVSLTPRLEPGSSPVLTVRVSETGPPLVELD